VDIRKRGYFCHPYLGR